MYYIPNLNLPSYTIQSKREILFFIVHTQNYFIIGKTALYLRNLYTLRLAWIL